MNLHTMSTLYLFPREDWGHLLSRRHQARAPDDSDKVDCDTGYVVLVGFTVIHVKDGRQ